MIEIAKAWLRPFLFHDVHHLVRYTAENPSSLVEHAVKDGLDRSGKGATPT